MVSQLAEHRLRFRYIVPAGPILSHFISGDIFLLPHSTSYRMTDLSFCFADHVLYCLPWCQVLQTITVSGFKMFFFFPAIGSLPVPVSHYFILLSRRIPPLPGFTSTSGWFPGNDGTACQLICFQVMRTGYHLKAVCSIPGFAPLNHDVFSTICNIYKNNDENIVYRAFYQSVCDVFGGQNLSSPFKNRTKKDRFSDPWILLPRLDKFLHYYYIQNEVSMCWHFTRFFIQFRGFCGLNVFFCFHLFPTSFLPWCLSTLTWSYISFCQPSGLIGLAIYAFKSIAMHSLHLRHMRWYSLRWWKRFYNNPRPKPRLL